MKHFTHVFFTTLIAGLTVCFAIVAAVSHYHQQYLDERSGYPPTSAQYQSITALMKQLCVNDSDFCAAQERVSVHIVKDFALASIPVFGELLLTGETVYGNKEDTVLLPEGLFARPSLLTVTLAHELLHVHFSDKTLNPHSVAFCEDHNRIKQLSVDKLVAMKHHAGTYLLDRDIHSSANHVQQCQSV